MQNTEIPAYKLGQRLYKRKFYTQAETQLLSALEDRLTPVQRHKSYESLGLIYVSLAKKWIMDEDKFRQKALKIGRKHIEWYTENLPVLKELGDFEWCTDVFYRLSKILEKEGRVPEAMLVLEKAIKLDVDPHGKHQRRAKKLRAQNA